jgi:hypothetical protein
VINKEELLVKIYAGQLASPQILETEIKRHQQLHIEKLAIYQEIERQMHGDSQTLPQFLKYPYLTLRMGIKFEIAWIEWCEEAIASLN